MLRNGEKKTGIDTIKKNEIILVYIEKVREKPCA